MLTSSASSMMTNVVQVLKTRPVYVYDIDYKESDLLKDAADVLTPEVSLGNDVLTAGGVMHKDWRDNIEEQG